MTLTRTFEQVKTGKFFRKKLQKKIAKKHYWKEHIDFILKFNIGDKVFIDEYGFLTIKNIEPIYKSMKRISGSKHKKNRWFLDYFRISFVEKEILTTLNSYDFEDSYLSNSLSYEDLLENMKKALLKDLCYANSFFKIPYIVVTLPKEEVFNEDLTYKKEFLKKLTTEYDTVNILPWPLIDHEEKCFCYL